MLRFISLGSGSSGNATLVEAQSGTLTTRLLIDCGFALRQLDARLERAGLAAGQIDAVFVTHEHSDHVGCAVQLARRERIPLWTSHGTWAALGQPEPGESGGVARDGQAIAL
ncbi:MAG: MBL fold metallo-hydrolase, partial [Proteobacteria bacterium]|nr:MBL fold metallo-hydrolase [Pseudomonadota bacterium]